MSDLLHFKAIGIAQPKGSARAFVPKGWTRAVVTSANPKNKNWQQIVSDAAQREIEKRPGFQLFDGPVRLELTFVLPAPKSLKDKRPPHTKKPDLDKLVRSVKDALSGVAWRDDAQVTDLVARKDYAAGNEPPCVYVDVLGRPAGMQEGR